MSSVCFYMVTEYGKWFSRRFCGGLGFIAIPRCAFEEEMQDR